MKKFIIAALLAITTTSAFAEDYFLINGKKIGLHESKKSMITKLGKPTSAKNNWISWETNNISVITAEFDQFGLSKLSTSKGAVVVNGKTISIGKDTPNNIKLKLDHYCSQFDNGTQQRMSMQSTRVGAEGEISIIFYAIGDGSTADKKLLSTPIDTIELNYQDPLYEPKCNY